MYSSSVFSFVTPVPPQKIIDSPARCRHPHHRRLTNREGEGLDETLAEGVFLLISRRSNLKYLYLQNFHSLLNEQLYL